MPANGVPNSWSGKLGQQMETMLAQGRRQSAATIQRLRSGSLSGWAGNFSNPFKSAHFAPGGDGGEENPASVGSRIPQRLRRMSIDPSIWRQHGNASLGSVLSALYAKLLVVMGMAFPMSEVISTYVPPAYYDGFYLYLYLGSILFMGWLFSTVIKHRAKKEITKGVNSIKLRLHTTSNKSVTDGSTEGKSDDEDDHEDHDHDHAESNLHHHDHVLSDMEANHDDASSSTCGAHSLKTDKDTHSEDSDDKLSPLPTEEATGANSPLLSHKTPPRPPAKPMNHLHHHAPITSQPSVALHPINHHLNQHPHNMHVTINSGPGHDGQLLYPQPPSNNVLHHEQLHHILKFGHDGGSNGGFASPPRSKGKLSRTTSVESGKYDGSSGQRSHFGSFYLRMGAVAFGVGSMIYSCLEFGQFLEQEPDTKCHSYMQAFTPVVRIIFTFMQMYFIFLNSRMSVSKVSWVKQFGLMHMIGTNLCVWLNVLVQETKHEILHFYDPENGTITVVYGLTYYGKSNTKALEEHAKVVAAATSMNSIASALIAEPPVPHFNFGFSNEDSSMEQQSMRGGSSSSSNATNMLWSLVNQTASMLSAEDMGGQDAGHRLKRGLMGPHTIYECARENIMGSLVNNASPFLFPCTIEYSLICAAICYVMWKSMAKRRVKQITLKRTMHVDNSINHVEARNVHHYTVDCAGSNKGLFIGIFFLVFTIMSLILNFVLMKHHEHLEFAFWEVNLTEITLYAVSTLAVLIGMCQMRQLRYESGKNLELDSILLIVAQSGSFMFNVFCIVGGHLTPLSESNMWILVTPLLCLIQLLLQTLFILDASKRIVATPEMARKKPGREIVTFLLVTNLAMWLINALEKSRGDSHPHLLRFYGVWAWTIITDIAMPLAIFYRFHSTVCLCEIWKKAYKERRKFGQHHEPLMRV